MFFPPRKVVGSPDMTLMVGGVMVNHLYQSNCCESKKKWLPETV